MTSTSREAFEAWRRRYAENIGVDILPADAVRLAWQAATEAERERCAKVAEVIPDSKVDLDHEPARTEQQIRNGIAQAIREGR